MAPGQRAACFGLSCGCACDTRRSQACICSVQLLASSTSQRRASPLRQVRGHGRGSWHTAALHAGGVCAAATSPAGPASNAMKACCLEMEGWSSSTSDSISLRPNTVASCMTHNKRHGRRREEVETTNSPAKAWMEEDGGAISDAVPCTPWQPLERLLPMAGPTGSATSHPSPHTHPRTCTSGTSCTTAPSLYTSMRAPEGGGTAHLGGGCLGGGPPPAPDGAADSEGGGGGISAVASTRFFSCACSWW